MNAFDAIVVGVGGMGNAALGHLAGRGLKVLGIEQFGVGHSRGSSHGQTRIIRQAYFEHPDYVPLLKRAYQLWDELETRKVQTLFCRAGLVQIGRAAGGVIPGVDASARLHNLPVQRMSRQECMSRFPQLFVPEGNVAIFEANAGYLLVEDCVHALAEVARLDGATILEDTPVVGIEPNERECIVKTANESFVAKHLVITAGAWCRSVLPLPVSLRVLRKHLDWFDPADRRMDSVSGCPAFLYDLPDGCFYGFPAVDERGVKVAEHSGGEEIVDPGSLESSIDPRIRSRIDNFVQGHLPLVTLRHRQHQVCMYTMSPDEHFIVDRHPSYKNVVVVGGLSGHGFKFATALGEIAAELVVDGRSSLPIEFLGFQRFAANLMEYEPESTEAISRHEFLSRGTRCVADYHRTVSASGSPIVVMAHGFASERTFALSAYARRFARAGLGVLVFDYRGIGESDGLPRHVVSYRRQREDYRAAIEFARTLDGVDPNRVVLWGTSYSGGHVIAIAAEDHGIAAIVAQIPAVDVPAAAAAYGLSFSLRAAAHALYDIGRSICFLSPHYVPVFATPDRFAVLNRPGCEAGYKRLIPAGSSWLNRCAARELLLSLGNRPIRQASLVTCPTLVVLAQRDQILPREPVIKLASLIPDCTLIESPGDHFGVYEDGELNRLIDIQTEFMLRSCGK